MLERLRSQIGTAGLVVAIVALVAALGGGAYAASGGPDGDKASASAKAKQGKQGKRGKTGKTGPAGPAGPVGPAGPAGAKGDTGAPGANGANGAPGASGKSVVLANGASGCTTNGGAGGTSVEVEGTPASKKFVCNGSPWTAGGTLPSGATETGAWSVVGPRLEETSGGTFVPLHIYASVSFPIPLEESLDETQVHFIDSLNPPGGACTGSALEPTAAEGNLCIYLGNGQLTLSPGEGIFMPDFSALGAGPSGAIMQFVPEQSVPAFGFGSWAVTAP
ncbi:MAG: hypothetical protein WA862_09880 [Solirubrobacterales bacterium]